MTRYANRWERVLTVTARTDTDEVALGPIHPYSFSAVPRMRYPCQGPEHVATCCDLEDPRICGCGRRSQQVEKSFVFERIAGTPKRKGHPVRCDGDRPGVVVGGPVRWEHPNGPDLAVHRVTGFDMQQLRNFRASVAGASSGVARRAHPSPIGHVTAPDAHARLHEEVNGYEQSSLDHLRHHRHHRRHRLGPRQDVRELADGLRRPARPYRCDRGDDGAFATLTGPHQAMRHSTDEDLRPPLATTSEYAPRLWCADQ